MRRALILFAVALVVPASAAAAPAPLSADRSPADIASSYGSANFGSWTVDGPDVVYAPFGDDSLLLHDVTIRNTGSKTLSGSYFEYWDVNPAIQGVTQFWRGYNAPSWDAQSKTLSVAQMPDEEDTKPLTIFATALAAPVSAYDTDTNAFFGSGTRAAPAAVAAGKLTNSTAAPSPNRS